MSMSTSRIHVLVTHRERLLELGVEAAVGTQVDMLLSDGSSPQVPVGVVVCDLDTGRRLAIQAQQGELPPILSAARLLVLSLTDHEEDIRHAMEQGIQGYAMVACPPEQLLHGIRVVSRGARFLCMLSAQRMAELMARETLSSREAEVLDLVAQGMCNKSIARALGIAVGTVKAHVKSVMGKLEASSRTHATSIAVRRGLIRTSLANDDVLGLPVLDSVRAVHSAA